MRAHAAAREAIKAICPEVKVGLTLSLHDLQAQPGGEAFAAAAWEEEFTHYLPYIKEDDFLGVQNYTRTLYGAQGQLPAPQGAELTQMDYEFYPQALENVIRKVAQDFHGDLIVTETALPPPMIPAAWRLSRPRWLVCKTASPMVSRSRDTSTGA